MLAKAHQYKLTATTPREIFNVCCFCTRSSGTKMCMMETATHEIYVYEVGFDVIINYCFGHLKDLYSPYFHACD